MHPGQAATAAPGSSTVFCYPSVLGGVELLHLILCNSAEQAERRPCCSSGQSIFRAPWAADSPLVFRSSPWVAWVVRTRHTWGYSWLITEYCAHSLLLWLRHLWSHSHPTSFHASCTCICTVRMAPCMASWTIHYPLLMSAIFKQEQLQMTPWILATRFRYAGTLLNDHSF